MAERIHSQEVPSPVGGYEAGGIPAPLGRYFKNGMMPNQREITRTGLEQLQAACAANITLCGEVAELPAGYTATPSYDGRGVLERYDIAPPAGSVLADRSGDTVRMTRLVRGKDGMFYFVFRSDERTASLRELVARLPSYTKALNAPAIEAVRARLPEVQARTRELVDAYRVFHEARRRYERGEKFDGREKFDNEKQETLKSRFLGILGSFEALPSRISGNPPLSADQVATELDENIMRANSLLGELQSRTYWYDWESYAQTSETKPSAPGSKLGQIARLWYESLFTQTVGGLSAMAGSK